jgi:energy-coupling factor transporter ATP-binding protein EcfA2
LRIKNFSVSGLPAENSAPISYSLNNDLNILTGRNGSGKTTLLKLLWYVISGNIEHAIREVPFTSVQIETTDYKITIRKQGSEAKGIEIALDSGAKEFEPQYDEDGDQVSDPVIEANDFVMDYGSSVFFPTFRRIEGGFSIRPSNRRMTLATQRTTRSQIALEEALQELSRKMTVNNHTFVTSISTVDIVDLLMKQYTEMSELSNNLQRNTSDEIIERIMRYQRRSESADPGENADELIDKIKSMIEELNRRRESLLEPLNAVRSLVQRLFQHSGIVLNSRLSFGDAANAVTSEALSAGEKQLLSFICYNAFYKDSIIFIDEPELSRLVYT